MHRPWGYRGRRAVRTAAEAAAGPLPVPWARSELFANPECCSHDPSKTGRTLRFILLTSFILLKSSVNGTMTLLDCSHSSSPLTLGVWLTGHTLSMVFDPYMKMLKKDILNRLLYFLMTIANYFGVIFCVKVSNSQMPFFTRS